MVATKFKVTSAICLLLTLGCHSRLSNANSAVNDNATTPKYPTTTKRTATTQFVPHRFSSHNNITILHEVHGGDAETVATAAPLHKGPPITVTTTEQALVLNTHEILPASLKPAKKKPYTLLDKRILPVIPVAYEKPSRAPLKPYELHPVTFDFNLGDLEDFEHETIKKAELSSEEQYLLRNAKDDGFIYHSGEEQLDDNDQTALGVAIDLGTPTTLTVLSSTTTSTTTSGAILSSGEPASTHSSPPTVATVSPHIFKIAKTNKSIKKGRELLKQHDAATSKNNAMPQHNSISRYFGAEAVTAEANGTTVGGGGAEGTPHGMNMFQSLTNLYDHFYWQAAEIRTKVSTGCGLEMHAYLMALHANYEWAQRAYDASGRYRGQVLFGNDKWIGQMPFCYELNRQLKPEERKHFEFEFYVSIIALQLRLPQHVDMQLQLGECLPRSCSIEDVTAILSLDPHAHMFLATPAELRAETNVSTATAAAGSITVLHVRSVPGRYNFWRELKFQIFAFLLSLLAVVLAATWYQALLNQRQLKAAPSIAAISIKLDASLRHTLASSASDTLSSNGNKTSELYQMRTFNNNNSINATTNANNNVVEIDVDADNGGMLKPVATDYGTNGQAESTSQECTIRRATTFALTAKTPEASEYEVETHSQADATVTYEAKQQLGLPEQILLCFAFQSNSNGILNIDEHKESQTSCVHGLRVFSVLWTILVHTYLQMFSIGENRYRRIIVERSIWYQFIGNATFSVDTFFFISGFLVTLLFLKQEKKYPEGAGQFVRRSTIDTLWLVIYRYVRLTPAYYFVILFTDFSLRHTYGGSVFPTRVSLNTCGQYWWRNILYINNFYPLKEICMIWSWYMANDMQFYIMGSILLVLSLRYFKAAVLIVVTFLLSSWGISGIISLHYRYTHKVSQPFESFDFLYDKPWQRVGTYIMGMLAGYTLYRMKTAPKISSRTNRFLWLSSLLLLAFIIFGVWDGELNILNTAFYVSVGHTAFGLSLIWIVLSCCWGLAPTVNRILSYRCLWPLSRLTYCTYLIHPVIMLITAFRMDGTVHLNNLFVFIIFLGNAVLSFGMAFFISVFFEAPVIRLLKICFKK